MLLARDDRLPAQAKAFWQLLNGLRRDRYGVVTTPGQRWLASQFASKRTAHRHVCTRTIRRWAELLAAAGWLTIVEPQLRTAADGTVRCVGGNGYLLHTPAEMTAKRVSRARGRSLGRSLRDVRARLRRTKAAAPTDRTLKADGSSFVRTEARVEAPPRPIDPLSYFDVTEGQLLCRWLWHYSQRSGYSPRFLGHHLTGGTPRPGPTPPENERISGQ